MQSSVEDVFGPAISIYTRAQAIEDGVLVDVSKSAREDGFKYPVAMSRAAWSACVEAGGTWETVGDDECLRLPTGQDIPGRLHDVLWMLHCAISKRRGGNRVDFSVLIDTHADGRHKRVDLYSLCGPGDRGEPCITIMLPNED